MLQKASVRSAPHWVPAQARRATRGPWGIQTVNDVRPASLEA